METFIKLAGLFAGIGIGGAPILSASWIWFRKQTLGVGGISLLVTGTLILTVSLAAFGDWTIVKIESKAGDWVLELQKVNERLAELENSVVPSRQEIKILEARIMEQRKLDSTTLNKEIAQLKKALFETEKSLLIAKARDMQFFVSIISAQLNSIVDQKTAITGGWNTSENINRLNTRQRELESILSRTEELLKSE